ncbi:hypothetical protein HG535_0E02850 [Zygotorulaspora mrakii]|uniref:DNA helicase n=1 Tax=Zygotorulaspora mrakii TaxID=42260 RepID=A0A7H9B3G6_ZYGMR|nr:uncharacterized protein HG535_0E02850 [Zygotorulaspora mrakii]QLG73201.1 hypothetical protein HG535_0E02850 [Zygotorulaspora mrakii]
MSDYNDNDVQVPESSSPGPVKNLSSSPLKYSEQDGNSTSTSLLRDKFSFSPGSASLKASNAPDLTPNSGAKGNPDMQLSILADEFPDFSPTLVQAVFKSNSFNLKLARERLERIRDQRKSWSAGGKGTNNKRPGTPQSAPTNRLGSIPNSTSRLSSINAETSSKIVVEKQRTSIFDRYSNVMNQRTRPSMTESLVIDEESLAKLGIASQNNTRGPRKRRLVRANDMDSKRQATHLDKAKQNLMNMKMKKRAGISDEDESDEAAMSGAEDLSGEEYEERTPDINIDDQVLEFLNTAGTSDIADLGEANLEKAEAVISHRPYNSLYAFSQTDFTTEKEQESQKQSQQRKNRRGASQKKESERLLEKINQSIKGYNAIDSLIGRCSSYGKLIASQMKRWGVDMEKAANGDLDFMDVDSDDSDVAVVEEFDESEVSATPTPVPDVTALMSTKHRKRKDSNSDFEEDDDVEVEIDTSEDEDYGQIKRKSTPGRRGRPATRGQVKFFKAKPKLLSPTLQLKDYQQTGINWLNLLYHNHMSCILADDMGLGKTCQVIAFFAYLKQINEPGPHLVVVPSSTLENWLREFQKFCPSLKIEPYYGSQQDRAGLREILERTAGQYDVIVTTYNLAAGNKYDISFLRNCQFNVVVYDEGHMLKNSMSERFNKLMRIQGNFRLLLTGTPLQNNLKELMSLLEFIMPNLFESKKDHLATIFKQRARTTDENKGFNPLLAQEAINRAKMMMKPFILRRRKDQVLKHLPAKHRTIEYCEMVKSQRDIYNAEIKLVMEHKKMVQDGTLPDDPKERAKIQKTSSKNLIMALRKASIHPLLFRALYDDKKLDKMSDAILDEPDYAENGNKQYIKEDMSYMTDFELHKLCCSFPNTLSKYQLKNKEWMDSGKISKLCTILEKIIVQKKEKVLIFSLFTQVLDILEKVLSTLNYKFLRLDGSTQVNDRQSLIDKFYEDESIPIFILSTKAGGFGINLVCANNVIIFDQSFNPHDDRQAADRSHRVGQTKEVTITTLITKDSIEEKIFQLAKNKLDLDTHVSEDDQKSQEMLDTKISGILEDIIFDENSTK